MNAARVSILALFALLAACPTGDPGTTPTPEPTPEPEPEWPPITPGQLEAGASSGYLNLPVGLPLAGYTGRDQALGGEPGADTRNSDYTTDFQASAGWQTAMPLQALWLTDGERHGVIVRMDLIYSWDELTEEIGRRLTEEIGEDLTNSVFTITGHSHSSPGTFTNATVFFLGSDVFSREIFNRIVDQAVAQALAAYEARVPARAGLGIDYEFDPIGDDEIFRDRRGENDHLLGVGGIPTGEGWKDQRATMLRVDAVSGDPIAALVGFGIHGTIMGGDNTLMSSEAPGHISTLLEERFGGPVWMFGQGAGGDASPAGRHSGFARMEWLAEASAERILSLYDAIELSDEPIAIDGLQRYIPQNREAVRVTRNGTVDLRYDEWQEEWVEFPPFPDEEVWDVYGNVMSPIDEFYAQHGAALCGDPTLTLPGFTLDVELLQYRSCILMEAGYTLFRIAFPEYFEDRESSWPLPLPGTTTAMVGALGLQGLPVTTVNSEDDDTDVKDVVLAFAPGEPTTLWTQFLRARAKAEFGVEEVFLLGYAMDHVGYLLQTEDWLQSGYEPSITVWGPLQGEALLERMIEFLPLATTPVEEDADWPDWPGETVYLDRTIPTVVPDETPEAGDIPSEIPPLAFVRPGASAPTEAQPAASVRRLQDRARFVFWGSDPAMGNPSVHVEYESTPGTWEPLRTPSGNLVDDRLPDIIVTYTPLPLSGTVDDPDPVREHLYVAEWQAVFSYDGLELAPGLPLGNYRLVASGLRRDGADSEYPFDGVAWSQASEPFEVVPAQVDAEWVDTSDLSAAVVRARYAAPGEGFRLVHMDRSATQSAPLHTPTGPTMELDGASVAVASQVDEGTWTVFTVDLSGAGINSELVVGDGQGNAATLSLPLVAR